MRLFRVLLVLAVVSLGADAATVTTTTLTNQQSFDFDTQTFGFLSGGDFYYLSQDCSTCLDADKDRFWANNLGQRGLQDIGPVALLSINSIPTSGYLQFGVPDVVGHSYISLAEVGETPNYIFFQVTGKTTSSVTINWIYGPAVPAAAPEPGTSFLLAGGMLTLLYGRSRKAR